MAKHILAVYDKPADRIALECCETIAKKLAARIRKSVSFEFVCSDVIGAKSEDFDAFIENEHCPCILYCGGISHKMLMEASKLISPRVMGLFSDSFQIYAPVCNITHEFGTDFARDAMVVPDKNTELCVLAAQKLCTNGKITFLHGAPCASHEKICTALEKYSLKYKTVLCGVSSFAAEDELGEVVVTTPTLFNIIALSGKMKCLSLTGGIYSVYAPTDNRDICSLLYAYSNLLKNEFSDFKSGEWLHGIAFEISKRTAPSREEALGIICDALKKTKKDGKGKK